MLETSGNEGVSIIEASMIKKGKECEAYVFEEIATNNDIDSEVAMDESTMDSCVKTFSTLVPETSAVALVCQCETGDTEGDGDSTKVEADAYEGEIAQDVTMGETTEDSNTEDSCPLILKTSAVVNEKQHGTEKLEGGGKKGKVGRRFGWKMIRTEFRSERKSI